MSRRSTYIEQIADDVASRVSGERLPHGDRRLLFLLYALLAHVKGTATTARDVHDAWMVWMIASGEQHVSMVPFEQLPPDVQGEDTSFVNAIREVAARLDQPDDG